MGNRPLTVLRSENQSRDLYYTVCERRKWAQDAIGYNALVLSWPDLKRQADEQKDLGPAQKELI